MKYFIKTLSLILISVLTILGLSLGSSVHADDSLTITFHAGESGEFEGGTKTNSVTYSDPSNITVKYSHTSNVDDTGLQNGDYGDSWTNANITGTDRGDTSKAHVVTIPGADTLTVDLYFNGESYKYDWVSVWAGSHPTYTAANSFSLAGAVTQAMGAPNATNKYGGSSLSGVTFGTYTVNGNTLTNMGHVTLTIPGDSVTFGFKSDRSGCGKGYGYYAIIKDGVQQILSGEYKEPNGYTTDNTQYFFRGWNTATDGTGVSVDPTNISSTTDIYAIYEELPDIGSGTFGCPWRIKADGALEIGKEGQNCTLSNDSRISNLESWPWYSLKTKITSASIKGSVSSCIDGSLSGMFSGQTSNTSIDLTGFDTSDATNFRDIFRDCSSLTKLNLGDKFDTSNGTDFCWMFDNCSSLTSLNLGDKFDTSNGNSFAQMFQTCSSLTSLNLGDKFDTSKGEHFDYMFSSCSSLVSLNLGDKFSIGNTKQTFIEYMFQNCSSLKALNLGDKFDTSNVTSFFRLFHGCSSLTSLNLGDKFDTSKGTDFRYMFFSCSSLTSLNLGNKFDTSNGTAFSHMFENCSSLTSLDLKDKFDTSNNRNGFESMFSGCSGLTSLSLGDKFDTNKAKNFSKMFYDCSSLISLNLGDKFDTSNGTEFNDMFHHCSKLTELDLGDKFDTSKGTNFKNMFSYCSSLTSLNLGDKFDTSNGTEFSYMFRNCESLVELDLGDKFDTSEGTDFRCMFSSCSSLTSLNLGDKFHTSKGTDVSNMFYGCSKLESLDLSTFNTKKATSSSYMFGDDTSLKSVILGPDFTFNGNGSITVSNRAILPTPSAPSTKWTRIYDSNTMQALKADSQTSLTAAELRDTYDGSTMAGLWVWDKVDPSSMGYGDNTKQYSVDGEWKQLSEDAWEYIFNVFDDTVRYYLTEDTMDGFTSDIDSATGYVTIQDKNGEITNRTTTELGSLTVRKVVSGISTTDKFDITVTLSGLGIPADGAKVIDGVVFTNGTAHIQLADGESKTFNGLPEGTTYTVSEENVSPHYDVVYNNQTGSIVKEGNIATVTNNYQDVKPHIPGFEFTDIVLTKTVVGTEQQQQSNYEFVMKMSDLFPNTHYLVETANGESDITEFTSDASGNATELITLQGGATLTFKDIPAYAKYSFVESAGDWITSYKITNADSNGTIVKESNANTAANTTLSTETENVEEGELTTVTFTNAFENKQNLKIAKMVADDPDDTSKFAFTVNFGNLNEGDSFTSSIGKITADDEGNATKEFYLTAGETVEFNDIPVGTTYQFTEAPSLYVASYELTSEAGTTPTIVKQHDSNSAKNKELRTAVETIDADEDITVVYTNSKEKGSMTVTKTGTENIDANTAFNILITLKGSRFGISGTYAATGTDVEEVKFDKNGQATVSLKKGQSITIAGLPVGATYTVEEVDPDDTYTKTYDKESGEITAGNVTATVNNDLLLNSDLSVKKIVRGNMGSHDKEFSFSIEMKKGSQPLTGDIATEGTSADHITFNANGIATFTLAHNQTITLKDVPIGYTYTVTEADYSAEGYTTTSTKASGIVAEAANDNKVEFTNTNGAALPTSAHTAVGAAALIVLISILGICYARRKHNKEA